MIVQPFTPDSYLGPYAADATAQQKDALTRAHDMITAHYPGPDDPSEQAMSGAAQIILDDATLEEVAAAHAAAQQRAAEARALLDGAIIAASATMSESEIARICLTRPTIRKILGK